MGITSVYAWHRRDWIYAVVVVIAALNLVLDFDFIEQALNKGPQIHGMVRRLFNGHINLVVHRNLTIIGQIKVDGAKKKTN